jgi:RNA polymerase sigma-70 factor, ECF subfamily
MSNPQTPEEVPSLPANEPSDHELLGRSRDGDQDAARQLYLRYARRLKRLVERQCSAQLARQAGVEDIVQSVFRSFFRRVGRGSYDVPDGDDLWKLLLVIALHKIRKTAAYHHAAKRDAHRTMGGGAAERHLEFRTDGGESPDGYFVLVVEEILEHLDPEAREMVRLRIDGHEIGEVARRVGRSRRTVERTLQEIRTKLGQLLHEEDRYAATKGGGTGGDARRLHPSF